jgi:hypothetical protein
MSSLYKTILFIGLFAIALVVGFYFGTKSTFGKVNKEENSNVVIEKIEKVAKLITVESHMSEIYSYKDYYSYDWSFLRKKALVRVNAKVSVGYDIKKLNIVVDGASKKIKIGPIPPVEILAIDHTLDYFDIEQGMFNSFTNEDYNHINTNAKEYIKKIASRSEIMAKAEEQRTEFIEILRVMASGMGYTLEIAPQKPN